MNIQLSQQAANAIPAVALEAFLASHGVKVGAYDADTHTLHAHAVTEQPKENHND